MEIDHIIRYELDGIPYYIVPNVKDDSMKYANILEVEDHCFPGTFAHYVSQDYFLLKLYKMYGSVLGSEVYSNIISKYIADKINGNTTRIRSTNPYLHKQKFDGNNMTVFHIDYRNYRLSDKPFYVKKSLNAYKKYAGYISFNFERDETGTYEGHKLLMGTPGGGDLLEMSCNKGTRKIMFAMTGCTHDWEHTYGTVTPICDTKDLLSMLYMTVNMPEFTHIYSVQYRNQ